jgi:hypothetical protein
VAMSAEPGASIAAEPAVYPTGRPLGSDELPIRAAYVERCRDDMVWMLPFTPQIC